MKMRFLFLIAILSAMVFAPKTTPAQTKSALVSTAQPTAGQPMLLDVVVTDKADRPVGDLKPEDFKVLDNKEARSIAGVRPVAGEDLKADPPTEAILLVDQIGSYAEMVAIERKGVEAWIAQSGAQLAIPTSLVFLTETELNYQGKPSRDPKVLLDNLEKNPNPQRSFQPQGGFEQWIEIRQKSLEAVNGLALKLRDRPGRKLVVWISPGWPPFSDQTQQKTAQQMQGLFDYIVGISTVLREARVTLYHVDPQGGSTNLSSEISGSNYQQYVKPVPSPKQADNGNLMLQVLATQTGGKVIYGSNNIAKMISQCLADAHAFYVLNYDAPHATHANEYHAVQIQVNKPGLKARTLTGYYAQP